MGGVKIVLLVAETDLKNGIPLGKILDGVVRNSVAGLDRRCYGDNTASFREYKIFEVWQILRCRLPGPAALSAPALP